MPINTKYLAKFRYGHVYHIFNRTNNKETLFRNHENHLRFLNQFVYYIVPIADVFAWTLLPNHFHFLIRIKSSEEITDFIKSLPRQFQTKSQRIFLENGDISKLSEMEFKRFFTSYAMLYNKMHGRKGNLFNRPFRRVLISENRHFTKAIIYIHANAQKHKLVKDFTDYQWTSFHEIVNKGTTFLLKDELLEWFGGLDDFKNAHVLFNSETIK